MGPRRRRLRIERGTGRAAALHRTLRRARRGNAGRWRRLCVRERHARPRPAPRLCRRVQARLLRVGKQGSRQVARRCLAAVDDLRAGAREPAAAHRQRPAAHRGAHPLQRHAQRMPCRAPRRPGRPGEARAAAPLLPRARKLQARAHQPADHRRRRQCLRHHRRTPARGRCAGGRDFAPAHAMPVLLLRRRRGPAARAPVRTPGRQPERRGRRAAPRPGKPVHDHARRRPVRRRQHSVVQRRPVPEDRGAGPERDGRGRAAQRRRAGLERHRRQHLRHPVRTRAGPEEAQPARRALHRCGDDHARHRTGGAAPAARRMGNG